MEEKKKRGRPPKGSEKGTRGGAREGCGKKKGSVKTGGRVSGSPTIEKNEQRIFIREFLARKRPDFEDAFDALDPQSKCSVYSSLVKYVVPVAKEQEEINAQSNLSEALQRLAGLKQS